jgi:hypothetical protein
MTWHATTLQILYVSVVYQLDREWCPSSLGMSTFVVMLLVRKMHVWVHINETVICGLYRHCLRWFLLNLSIVSIQEGVTGRHSRVARNFLSKFEEKVTSLGRWWCTKASKRDVKNIWRCHLGQSRERELNASGGDTSEDQHDHHKTALAYWRQNHRQYPPAWLWDIFYYDLLFKFFESRYELRDWYKVRLQQLNDSVYYKEQRLKAEEEERLA